MTELEEYYLDRLISEYDRLEKLENLVTIQEEAVAKLEEQITNIFGEEKANEMYDKYKDWKDKMEKEV